MHQANFRNIDKLGEGWQM